MQRMAAVFQRYRLSRRPARMWRWLIVQTIRMLQKLALRRLWLFHPLTLWRSSLSRAFNLLDETACLCLYPNLWMG
jgi:hypothetical protein